MDIGVMYVLTLRVGTLRVHIGSGIPEEIEGLLTNESSDIAHLRGQEIRQAPNIL